MKLFGKILLWVFFPFVMVGILAAKLLKSRIENKYLRGMIGCVAGGLVLAVIIAVGGGNNNTTNTTQIQAKTQVADTQSMSQDEKAQIYVMVKAEMGVWERAFAGEAKNMDGSMKSLKEVASQRYSIYSTVPPIAKNEAQIKELYSIGQDLATSAEVLSDNPNNSVSQTKLQDNYLKFVSKGNEIMAKYEADYKAAKA